MLYSIITVFTLTASTFASPLPKPASGLGAEAAGAIAKSTTVAQVGSVAKVPNQPDAVACNSFLALQATKGGGFCDDCKNVNTCLAGCASCYPQGSNERIQCAPMFCGLADGAVGSKAY